MLFRSSLNDTLKCWSFKLTQHCDHYPGEIQSDEHRDRESPSAFLATQVELNFLPSGLREGHKSKNFLGKRERRRLLAWGGEGRFEMGWRGLWQGAGALLAAEGGSGYCSFAMRERGSWDASTLLGSRCVLL